ALPSLGSIGSMALGASALRFASVAAPALLVAVVAIALVWSTSPRAASAATLTVFSGQVERLEGDKWVPVEDGAPVKEGDTIRTADGSFAMVTFPDGSTATVDAATRLAFEDITVDGERQISIRQESGRIWNDVVPIEGGDSYVIHTPHAVVRAHGT